MSDQHATTPRRRVPITGLLGALLLLVASTATAWAAAPRHRGRADRRGRRARVLSRGRAERAARTVRSNGSAAVRRVRGLDRWRRDERLRRPGHRRQQRPGDRVGRLVRGRDRGPPVPALYRRRAEGQDTAPRNRIPSRPRTSCPPSERATGAPRRQVPRSRSRTASASMPTRRTRPNTKGGGGIPSRLIIAVVLALVLGAVFWLVKGRSNHAVFKEARRPGGPARRSRAADRHRRCDAGSGTGAGVRPGAVRGCPARAVPGGARHRQG